MNYPQRTYTGRIIDVGTPNAADVDIRDIAHHAALQNRYNGATYVPLSVAQHAEIVSRHVPGCYALEGLLHDAAEAYVGDLTRAVKRYVDSRGPGAGLRAFSNLHDAWLDVIFKAFGVSSTEMSRASIKRVDDRVCLDEMLGFLEGWTMEQYSGVETRQPLGITIPVKGWRDAKFDFLRRFKALTA